MTILAMYELSNSNVRTQQGKDSTKKKTRNQGLLSAESDSRRYKVRLRSYEVVVNCRSQTCRQEGFKSRFVKLKPSEVCHLLITV